MNRNELIEHIRAKKSFLCVGLDPDIDKLPSPISRDADGILEFCTHIIEATKEYCVAYKINSAFFEALGWKGYRAMEEVISRIPKTHFIIADAKRGDIGNTSKQYAKAFFETMGADAITIAPYMGADSVQPFLSYKDRWGIVLGLTSNAGSADFELLEKDGMYFFEAVLGKSAQWGDASNMMYVIGATQSSYMERIRRMLPHHFFLVPGVGAQGGSLEDVCQYLMNDDIGILVNLSREIIYASSGMDYAIEAGKKAQQMARKMSAYL